MANYVLPAFNLAVNIWRFGAPLTPPPSVVAVGNLSPGRISGIAPAKLAIGGSFGQGGMWLRLPPGTDVRDGKAAAGPDTVEVPAWSGRYYTVAWVDDIGLGFANSHRFAEIVGVAPWPTPFPGAGPFPPPAVPFTFHSDTGVTSGGIAVNSLACVGINFPLLTDWSICAFHVVDATGGPPVFTRNAVVQTPIASIVGMASLGHVVDHYLLMNFCAAGVQTWTLTLPGINTGFMAASQCQMAGGITTTSGVGITGFNVGGATGLAFAATPAVPAGLFASFNEGTPNVFDAWVAPFGPINTPLNDLVGLATFRLSLGVYSPVLSAIYSASTGTPTPNLWTGLGARRW